MIAISFWTTVRAAFVVIAPIGYALTAPRFAQIPVEYLLLNAVSTVAFVALAWGLDAPVRQFPACIIAIVFLVCYYLEFYLLVVFPWLMDTVPLPPNIFGFSSEYYLECFSTMTAGLVAFAAVTVLWAPRLGRMAFDLREIAIVSRRGVKGALAMAAAIIAIYLWFNVSRNIVAGGAPHENVFYLYGLVQFSFSIPAQMLLLMVIDIAWVTSNLRLVRVALAIWLPPLIYTTFVITSKGAIFSSILEFLFLWILAGRRLDRWMVVTGIVGIVVGSICFPVINATRALRVDAGMSTGDAISVLLAGSSSLSDALRAVAAPNGGNIALSIMAQILGRLTGSNVLLPIEELRYPFLGWSALRVAGGMHGIVGHFTSQMLRLGDVTAEKISAAMGMLGFFWIIGGNAAVIAGVAGLTSLVLAIWHYLPRFTLVSTRAAQAALLMLILGGSMDGSLQQLLFHFLPFWAASVALCEWLGRTDTRRQRSACRVERSAPIAVVGEL